MGFIVVVLLLALALAAAVIFYAAYPYRGEATPVSPRLGEALRRGVEALPTLDRELQDQLAGRRPVPVRVPATAGLDAVVRPGAGSLR